MLQLLIPIVILVAVFLMFNEDKNGKEPFLYNSYNAYYGHLNGLGSTWPNYISDFGNYNIISSRYYPSTYSYTYPMSSNTVVYVPYPVRVEVPQQPRVQLTPRRLRRRLRPILRQNVNEQIQAEEAN